MSEPVPLSPAAEARVEAAEATAVAQEATAEEAADAIENVAVERAQEATERAEAAAADVALAAIHTQLGQLIAAERSARETWQSGHDQIHQSLLSEIATVKTRMEEIGAQIAEAITRLPPVVEVLSTPPASPAPIAEATTIVPPEAVGNAAPMPAGSVAPARKKIRLI
jgi:hypothetical protein